MEMFRLPEIKKVLSIVRLEDRYPQFIITGFFLVAILLLLGSENAYEKMKKFKPTVLNLLLIVFLFTWCVFSFAGISEFLYFNF